MAEDSVADTLIPTTKAADTTSYSRLQARAELLDFLLEIADLTAATLDLDEMLRQVAAIIAQVLPQDLLAILVYSKRRKGLRIIHSRGHREELVNRLLLRPGEGLMGMAALKREPIVVGDVRSSPDYITFVDAINSEMALPMIVRGRLVGVIDLQSTVPNVYTREHVALGRLIAARVAAAIENARLHRRTNLQKQTLETLAKLNRDLSTLDLDSVLGRLADWLKTLVPFDAMGVYLLDEQLQVLRKRFTQRAWGEHPNLIAIGSGIVGSAAESRQIIRVGDVTQDSRYIEANPGVVSEVAVPLMNKGRLIGVLDVESRQPNRFRDDELRLLSLIARELAISIENAQLFEELQQREQNMQQDLLAAQRVQSILLGKQAPKISGLEVSLSLRPARQVSGDIYDFFVRPDGSAIIAFGDVSGKGAAAALYGALMNGLLRSLAPDEERPAELLRLLNETLLERRVDTQYVTLTMLLWDPQERRLTVANAGAIPPLVMRKGKHIPLDVEGVPIGLLPGQSYDEVTLDCESGDQLLLFSDGIADQESLAGPNFGQERLINLLEQNQALNTKQLVRTVFAELDEFMAGVPIQDDQTVVAIKITD
jgi:phosphoserine phosphatase RsbU/P